MRATAREAGWPRAARCAAGAASECGSAPLRLRVWRRAAGGLRHRPSCTPALPLCSLSRLHRRIRGGALIVFVRAACACQVPPGGHHDRQPHHSRLPIRPLRPRAQPRGLRPCGWAASEGGRWRELAARAGTSVAGLGAAKPAGGRCRGAGAAAEKGSGLLSQRPTAGETEPARAAECPLAAPHGSRRPSLSCAVSLCAFACGSVRRHARAAASRRGGGPAGGALGRGAGHAGAAGGIGGALAGAARLAAQQLRFTGPSLLRPRLGRLQPIPPILQALESPSSRRRATPPSWPRSRPRCAPRGCPLRCCSCPR